MLLLKKLIHKDKLSNIDIPIEFGEELEITIKPANTKNSSLENELKNSIKDQTKFYYEQVHKPLQSKAFVAGETTIPVAGRVFDEAEMINLTDASLDFWLTSGPWTEKFERGFAKKLGVRFCCLVNSGSSANLLAFMTLTSDMLGERKINKGDEVITVAAGFPTTINPILQHGAIPVFVDISLPSYNIDISALEKALSKKTKAVMIAHTLGNPFDLKAVKAFCEKHSLWLVEDNCDGLGSRYDGKLTGTFGDIATSSFYPAHHITTGEGGAVYTNNSRLKLIMLSLRDWGRHCYCDSGKDNTCKKRFGWQLGKLPQGYDHKYTYSHFGYNLKATDLQAAIGCAQLEKLDSFIQSRRENWQILYNGLKDFEALFYLPKATLNSEPSWFGFPLTIKDHNKFSKKQIVTHLESNKIQTRMLFAGNFIYQPAFEHLKEGVQYRVVGNLNNTNIVMKNTFWLGLYPGMKTEMLEFIIDSIKGFIKTLKY